METKATRAQAILGLFLAIWFTNPLLGQDLKREAKTSIQVFEIQERFGVAQPGQIIVFDLAGKIDPANTFMIGPEGEETVYQLIEGGTKVAVRIHLPAGAEKTWKLAQGRPSVGSFSAVRVEEKPGCFEITSRFRPVKNTSVRKWAHTPRTVDCL